MFLSGRLFPKANIPYNYDMNDKKNRVVYIVSGLILLVAVFFRFFRFPSVPPSLNWDEAAFGYNAYSVLKTGKDEYGSFMPLYFRSLDDYKLPVYTYSTVLSIFFFGYNDFSVRFPSAFFGICTVISIGFLAYGLTKNKWIGMSAGSIMAILPWNVQFSRMAAEANAGLFFLTLGMTIFIFSVRKKHWMLLLSPVSFALSGYSYLSFRIVGPLLGFMLVICFWKNLKMCGKKLISGFILTVIFIGMIFLVDMLMNNVHIRVKGTNVFSTQRVYNIFKHKEAEMFFDATKQINISRRLFHDITFFTSADVLIQGYLTHFSPAFLFFDYDEKQHHTPFTGLMYLWMLPCILIGLYSLISHYRKSVWLSIVSFLLITPIPASITWDIPHAIRAYGMCVPLVICASVGVYVLYKTLRRLPKGFFIGMLLMIAAVSVSAYSYLHQYIIHLPVERSKDWVYGRKELTAYLEANKHKYKKIIISSSLEWPYIFLLYYSKYDPALYQKEGGTVSGGWGEERNAYDIYEFHRFRREDINSPQTLFVGKKEEFQNSLHPLYHIDYLDGTPAIYMAEGGINAQ